MAASERNLSFVKTPSGRVRPIGVVTAWQEDPEEDLQGEPYGHAEKDKRNSDQASDRRHGPEGDPGQPVDDGLRSWLGVEGRLRPGVSPSRHAASRHT